MTRKRDKQTANGAAQPSRPARTAEDLARYKAMRERFQREKPSLDELVSSGEYNEPLPMGEYLSIRQAVFALRKAREAKGLSLADVAERTGIDKAALSRIETGQHMNPTVSTLCRYAHALGKRWKWILEEEDNPMDVAGANKVSFIELAKRVLERVKKPMSAAEIWKNAQQTGIASLLQSGGKTPEASLGARLYTDVQKPSSLFIKLGSGPAKFFLKSLAASIPNLEQQAVTQPITEPKQNGYSERDLHPLLVWFADSQFGAHCRTIRHEKSLKKSEKQNQWIHPDIVGFALTTGDWTNEVVQLALSTGAQAARLYSFELKISLDFPTLRESFFQAVSNSSWAHEGYLVAVEIDDDAQFRAELTRLSQSFGIGVIQLNTTEPADSTVLLAARQKTEIDWKTVDRIAAINPDFQEFVSSVTNSVKINQPAGNGFDKLLTDPELEIHLKKMLAK